VVYCSPFPLVVCRSSATSIPASEQCLTLFSCGGRFFGKGLLFRVIILFHRVPQRAPRGSTGSFPDSPIRLRRHRFSASLRPHYTWASRPTNTQVPFSNPSAFSKARGLGVLARLLHSSKTLFPNKPMQVDPRIPGPVCYCGT